MELPPLRRIDLDGPVAYREWDGPTERTFVLVHGLGASHLVWVQVAPALSGLGRVVAFDLPGFGASPLAGRGTGLMDQRRTLARVIAELASGVVVVGANSMGGATSILHAAVEPDSIAGLVLTNGVFPWRARAVPNLLVMLAFGLYWAPGVGERFVAWRLRELDAERIVRISLGVLAADPSSVPEEMVRLLVELTEQRRHDPDVTPAFLGAARSMLRLGRRPSISRRALDHVRCPVLLLHGRRDRLVPAAYAEAELARHPAWKGRFFADLGHIPQMEAPGRWLAEVADWSAGTFG